MILPILPSGNPGQGWEEWCIPGLGGAGGGPCPRRSVLWPFPEKESELQAAWALIEGPTQVAGSGVTSFSPSPEASPGAMRILVGLASSRVGVGEAQGRRPRKQVGTLYPEVFRRGACGAGGGAYMLYAARPVGFPCAEVCRPPRPRAAGGAGRGAGPGQGGALALGRPGPLHQAPLMSTGSRRPCPTSSAPWPS